jgi:predicted aspartyl protease
MKSRIVRRLVSSAASGVILFSLLAEATPGWAQGAAAPPTTPSATTTPQPSQGVTVPAKNGIQLKAEIDGQGPFDAVFDTGSGNVMTSSLAKRLGLKPEGTATLIAGGGNLATQRVHVNTVKIGGLVMSDQWFTIVNEDQQGILVGVELIKNLGVRVDFESHQITFYDQRTFKYSGNGTVVPIRYQDEFLVAQGSVDGIPGFFGIDTGDMWSLSLYTPFVAQHHLARRYGATIRGYAGRGYGGPDTGLYTRVNELRLGSYRLLRPITVLSMDTGGAESSKTNAGNIGLRLLRQFTLVFDYPHGKMYLERNSNYGKPDIFNRAGLVLDPDPDQLTVKTVIPSGPAARAGIAEDDVITQINGRPPDDDTVFSAFVQPVGTVVHLTVRNGQASRTVSLVLQDIL